MRLQHGIIPFPSIVQQDDVRFPVHALDLYNCLLGHENIRSSATVRYQYISVKVLTN